MITFLLTTVAPWLFKTLAGAPSAISAYLTSQQNTQLATTQAELAAITATNQARAQWLTAIGPMIVTCTAGELVVIYFGSIILDSMFHFGWQIAKLPAPWDGYAWVILGSFFLTSPIMALTSNFVRGK
jgi:hypothetical protein